MTFDYQAIRDSIVEPQLVEFGKTATLTQPGVPSGPAYDPTPGTPTVYPVQVLEIDFSQADRAGSLVQEDDIKFMLSTAGNPLPDLKGTLTIGSNIWQVTKLQPKTPGPVILFWYAYCRK